MKHCRSERLVGIVVRHTSILYPLRIYAKRKEVVVAHAVAISNSLSCNYAKNFAQIRAGQHANYRMIVLVTKVKLNTRY